MGASGSSRPEYLSPSKTLDFAKGSNSLTNANTTRISAIPQVIEWWLQRHRGTFWCRERLYQDRSRCIECNISLC